MKSLGSKLGVDAMRHHRAGAGVEHHDRAGVGRVVVAAVGIDQRARAVDALRERLLGDLLRVEVDGELHVVAGLRLAVTSTTFDRAALVVDLDLVLARRAAQLGLEDLLDAGLADDVVGLVAVARVRRRARRR